MYMRPILCLHGVEHTFGVIVMPTIILKITCLVCQAFTDSLQLNDKGQLIGFGQYLYLDDIFVSPADTIFPEGTYTVSASREAMTIEPGSLFKEDRLEMDRGCVHPLLRKS